MKYLVLAAFLVSYTANANAIRCADGVYRAGCVGPNGGAVVKKQPYNNDRYYHAPSPAYRQPSCASGPYRAGCAGPNGAVIVR
jgi:hypothetical protein